MPINMDDAQVSDEWGGNTSLVEELKKMRGATASVQMMDVGSNLALEKRLGELESKSKGWENFHNYAMDACPEYKALVVAYHAKYKLGGGE